MLNQLTDMPFGFRVLGFNLFNFDDLALVGLNLGGLAISGSFGSILALVVRGSRTEKINRSLELQTLNCAVDS